MNRQELGVEFVSKTISLLRFPMAVLIVLFHSSFEHELRDGFSIFEGLNASFYHHLDYMFVRNICTIAVPLFFVISGFLFFYKEHNFTVDIYMNKLKRRAKSLLLPYIIWNVLVLMLYFVVQNVAPSMNSGRTKLVMDFSIADYISCFWSMKDVNGMGTPIDGPLWFIRDLMVMTILSPIYFWVIKTLKVIVPLVLLLIYIWGVPITAYVFFAIGAYFGICKIDFVFIARKYLFPLLVTYVLVLVALVVSMDVWVIPTYVPLIEITIGVSVAVGLAAMAIENGMRPNQFLAGSTFFLFASHSEVLKVFIRLCSRFGPSSDLFYCCCYFVCPAVVCLLLLLTFKVLLIYMPKVASVLSGGR